MNVTFDTIFVFLKENKPQNNNQSGLTPNDFFMYQLTKTHNNFKAFDGNLLLNVGGVFLHLFKAYKKVWHEGVLYKLKNNSTDGNLYHLVKSFLYDRHQQVVFSS